MQEPSGLQQPEAVAQPSPAKPAKQDIAGQIRREQVNYLRRGSVLSYSLHPIAAGLIAIAMLGQVPHQAIGLWLLAVWAAAAARVILWHRYRASLDSAAAAAEWVALFTAIAVASGMLWGIAALVLWPADAYTHQILLLLSLVAVTAVDVLAMASFMPAVLSVLAATSLALFVALYWHGLISPLTICAMAFYAALLAVGARHINRLLFESLRLRFELAAATAAAQSANMAKSEFIANMSHELRTPLNAVIGFSEIIKDQMFGADALPRYVAYAADIHRSGSHLLEIINDILDLSKIEAGKLELKDERVELGEVVKVCLALVIDRAEQAGVALVADIPDPPPVIRGDERAVKQVLINLLSNAVKFTPIGGKVLVEVRADERGGVCLKVQDNGIGMSPADIPKAMEAFGQLESSQTRKYAGTGLGLPLVKSLVEMHGGQFRLISEVSVGTSAEVSLPARRVVSR
ncbi:MAG TPA: HAMP domain-containing sensor histidine kinase [Candidatus Sulfotelmatobacter sp.]|nr:HAMP domain-containing sensor histidine kinase [Candidatus Sulfotelmatobacter sp.]